MQTERTQGISMENPQQDPLRGRRCAETSSTVHKRLLGVHGVAPGHNSRLCQRSGIHEGSSGWRRNPLCTMGRPRRAVIRAFHIITFDFQTSCKHARNSPLELLAPTRRQRIKTAARPERWSTKTGCKMRSDKAMPHIISRANRGETS